MKEKLWDEEAYFSIEFIESSSSSSSVVIVLLVTFFYKEENKTNRIDIMIIKIIKCIMATYHSTLKENVV